MTYDGLVLAAVAAELRRTILGGRIQKVRQHTQTDLTLEVRKPGHTYSLFASVDARFPRIYLTAARLPTPRTPPNFCMLARKYIEGAAVTEITQPAMDRILRVSLDSSEHGRMTLIHEIMGKHSNLILVGADERILGAAKHVGSSVSRYRQVLAGREYVPPPATDKLDPSRIDAKAFDAVWRGSMPDEASVAEVKQWLIDTFSGFGPFLADEIIARTAAAGTITRDRLRDELLRLGAMVRESSFEAVLITSDRGEDLMVYPMPSAQFDASLQHPRESINEALDALFRTLVAHSELAYQRAQVLTSIRRATASRKQALKSIERTIAESDRAERYKQIGDLLVSSLHQVEPGARSVKLVDYYDPAGSEVEIELDEKLTPQQNAERYFRRYQKARDALASAQSRRTQVLGELEQLSSAMQAAESLQTADEARSLRERLTSQGLLRAEIARERQEDVFAGHRIRRLSAADGWEILYGETAQANDYLTQRVARPHDVWLHARSVTGAHVVARAAGRQEPIPPGVLRQALRIAAENSEARHSSVVAVDYTLRKFVRKPRGTAPGFVIYRNEKTVDVGMNQ